VPDVRLLRPTLTGYGVDARRSLDLVPALTPEALWIGESSSILTLGTGVAPAGVLDRGVGVGGTFRQGPEKYLGRQNRCVTFEIFWPFTCDGRNGSPRRDLARQFKLSPAAWATMLCWM
jgi:hypothetical protein